VAEVSAGGPLERREAVARLLAGRDDLLVITGLGSPSYDVMAAGDHPGNYYLWAAMGSAATVGLGLAVAQPARPVLVITGDGEMLMGVGTLATIAVAAPCNLAIVVQDNEHYGETGMQPTHTQKGVDLAGMARAAGIPDCRLVTRPEEVPALRDAVRASPGPLFAQVKIDAETKKLVLPPREGAHLQARFREAVLGPAAHLQ
jgi:thiamine pyrophosphate-dependent acetolactate synthase large subunit-like protein